MNGTWHRSTSRGGRAVQIAAVLVLASAFAVAPALGGSSPVQRAAATTTATFAAVADSYVQAAEPSANRGTDTKLAAGSAPIVRSYIRFSVSGIPTGATISSARLRLYATTSSASGVVVHGGVSDNTWGETTITYANAPAFAKSPLAASGAIVANRWIDVAVAPAVVGNGTVTFVVGTWDPAILRPSSGRADGGLSSESSQFSSREDSTALRPQLVVDYLTADPILVGAGDIADLPAGRSGADESTALLLDGIVAASPGRVTVFTAGDNAYDNGSTTDYADYYDPTWGRHKAITKPTPGNHEYQTPGGTGYYAYFGAAAGDPAKGYYAYDLGAWRIYALNSNIDYGAGSEQEQWLRGDLKAHAGTACVAAYWHYPRFSSGTHGSDPTITPLWQALYDNHADVVIVGHDHNYQRFAPQTPAGVRDDAHGIREFVAGTGGSGLYTFSRTIANTEASNTSTYGVLKLTLHATSYDFQFVPIAGKTYTDAGTGIPCH